jgi:isoquinoline 1-oxidoreductase beta subunit
MLIQAAAARWNVSAESCTVKNGAVWHDSQSLKYGEVVDAASKLPLPDFSTLKLKPASEFQLIGKDLVPRKDIPSKTDGSAKFGFDVRVPGMVYAMVERCPVFGGKAKSFDASKAKAIPASTMSSTFRRWRKACTRGAASSWSPIPPGQP